MIGNGGHIFASLLPHETHDAVYQNGPDVFIAGSAQPAGTAEAGAGGWRVNGRWPFASGCQHADWTFGLCVMTEDGKPLAGEEGAPLVRGFFLPARDWQVEDTWYVAGLKGTGSNHIAIRDAVVPTANFFDLMSGIPCLPGPLYQAVRQPLPLLLAASSGPLQPVPRRVATLLHSIAPTMRVRCVINNAFHDPAAPFYPSVLLPPVTLPRVRDPFATGVTPYAQPAILPACMAARSVPS